METDNSRAWLHKLSKSLFWVKLESLLNKEHSVKLSKCRMLCTTCMLFFSFINIIFFYCMYQPSAFQSALFLITVHILTAMLYEYFLISALCTYILFIIFKNLLLLSLFNFWKLSKKKCIVGEMTVSGLL